MRTIFISIDTIINLINKKKDQQRASIDSIQKQIDHQSGGLHKRMTWERSKLISILAHELVVESTHTLDDLVNVLFQWQESCSILYKN